MKLISGKDISEAAAKNGRVYLCGRLTDSNGLEHYENDGYEIGVSYYSEYTFETPHYHSFNTEYNFVLDGCLKVLLLNTGEEHIFRKGDMFIIETNEPYVGKCTAGSKTIFSKSPGGNDKVIVPADERVKHWGESWENIY